MGEVKIVVNETKEILIYPKETRVRITKYKEKFKVDQKFIETHYIRKQAITD